MPTPMIAIASSNATTRNIWVRSMFASSGWRAEPSSQRPPRSPMPMPTPSAPRPMRIDTPRIVKPTTVSISVSSRKGSYRSKNSMLFARVVSLAQVHDREHHEDVGLQRDHEDVEDRPGHVQQQCPNTPDEQPRPEVHL